MCDRSYGKIGNWEIKRDRKEIVLNWYRKDKDNKSSCVAKKVAVKVEWSYPETATRRVVNQMLGNSIVECFTGT